MILLLLMPTGATLFADVLADEGEGRRAHGDQDHRVEGHCAPHAGGGDWCVGSLNGVERFGVNNVLIRSEPAESESEELT